MNCLHIRSKQKTVLLFRIGQLGDTLVSLPAIDAIKKRHGEYRLILLTDRQKGNNRIVSSWDVLGPLNIFDEVVYYEHTSNVIGTIKNMFRLIFRLKSLGIQKAYNLAPERRDKQKFRDNVFFKYLLGITNYLDDKAVSWPPRNKSGKTSYVDPEWFRLLRVTGGDVQHNQYRLDVPQSFREEAERSFKALGIRCDGNVIAIGPGSKMPAKRWPRENYADLGAMLLDRYPDISLAVLGGKEDAGIGNELCAGWGTRAFNLAGKLSIYGSAAALERCAMYVGNDTGTMHLAAMVGKPCVAIFSSRDYQGKWEPYGDGHIIMRTDPACAGCMLEVCTRNMECLTAISPEDVMKQIDLMLRKKE